MQPILTDEMLKGAVEALRNERFLKGRSVEEFENNFAKYIGVRHAIALNNGTSALHLSLLAMGVGTGDCVITTTDTFIASANAILYTGARPVFADISLDTYTIDVEEIERRIRKEKDRVKAIIPVHLYGYPCEMDEILKISERYNIKVLEDACQAHGAMYKAKKTGAFGDAAAFSFYPSKNMTVCGDGGMVTTNNNTIMEEVYSLRDVGRSKGKPYLHNLVGFTARMNTVNAAIGNVQLRHLDEWNEKRRLIAKYYSEELEGVGDIILPHIRNYVKPAWHLYVIRTKRRDSLRRYLEEKEIETGIHYPIPVHLQPPYRSIGFSEGLCPNAEKAAKEVISLPMYAGLSAEELEYIVTNVKKFYKMAV
jgi:perosamine synthetase